MRMSQELKYTAGFKYQTKETFWIETGLTVGKEVRTHFVRLLPTGTLIIEKGFAWDGASGPTIDTESSFIGGLVHDALYRLMQQGLLDVKDYKKPADKLFYELLISQGMWKWRAGIWYDGVKDFGGSSAKTKKKVKTVKVKNETN